MIIDWLHPLSLSFLRYGRCTSDIFLHCVFLCNSVDFSQITFTSVSCIFYYVYCSWLDCLLSLLLSYLYGDCKECHDYNIRLRLIYSGVIEEESCETSFCGSFSILFYECLLFVQKIFNLRSQDYQIFFLVYTWY